MAQRNDRDPSRRGGTVTQITSAPRERAAARKEQTSAPPPPVSDPEAGTNFFGCFDLTDEERNGHERVDDVLDHHAANTPSSSAPVDERTERIDDRLDAIADGHDLIQEQLEHHHERTRPQARQGSPRGSADLAELAPAPRRRPSAPRIRRPHALWSVRPRLTARRGLIFVAVLIAVAVAAADLIHHPATTAVRRSAATVSSTQHSTSTGFTTLATSITHATRALGNELHSELAAREKTLRARRAAAARKAKARAEAPKRHRARERREHVKHHSTHHASTYQSHASAAPSGAGSQTTPTQTETQTTTVITTTAQPPARSSGSSAPAGPIGPGSSSGGCDPQCR